MRSRMEFVRRKGTGESEIGIRLRSLSGVHRRDAIGVEGFDDIVPDDFLSFTLCFDLRGRGENNRELGLV